MDKTLQLSEKIYLLAVHPKKGGIVSSVLNTLSYALIGAIFLELYLEKNVMFENKRVIVKNWQTKNSVHRFILEKMGKSKKTLKISRWINKLNFSQKRIRKQVQKSLTEKRMLRLEDKSFLFFKWKKAILVNKQTVYHLLSEIERSVFNGTQDEETILLLSMIKPAGLMKRLFPQKEKRKKAKLCLKNLMVENQVSAAVADAIAAAQAVSASVAATAAASSAATSG
jgi:hypothetical protein